MSFYSQHLFHDAGFTLYPANTPEATRARRVFDLDKDDWGTMKQGTHYFEVLGGQCGMLLFHSIYCAGCFVPQSKYRQKYLKHLLNDFVVVQKAGYAGVIMTHVNLAAIRVWQECGFKDVYKITNKRSKNQVHTLMGNVDEIVETMSKLVG